ncbi:hypothetical protein HDV06_003272 [Boothiomyces sp. JEL0866]|nr:hypothetical protein HDV06_003272 [Boothiomyces sp. JEL0866]
MSEIEDEQELQKKNIVNNSPVSSDLIPTLEVIESVQENNVEKDPIELEISKELELIAANADSDHHSPELEEELSVEDVIEKFNQLNQSGIIEVENIPDITPIQALNSWNDLVDHISHTSKSIAVEVDQEGSEDDLDNYAKEVVEKSGVERVNKGVSKSEIAPGSIGFGEEKSNVSSVNQERENILSRNNEFNTISGKKLLLETKPSKLKFNEDDSSIKDSSHHHSRRASESPMDLEYRIAKGQSTANISGASSKDLSLHSRYHSSTSLKPYRKKSIKTQNQEESIEHEKSDGSKPASQSKLLSENALHESDMEGESVDIQKIFKSTDSENLGASHKSTPLLTHTGKSQKSQIDDGEYISNSELVEVDRKELSSPNKPKVQFTADVGAELDDVPHELLEKRSAVSSAKSRTQSFTPKSAHTSDSGKSAESELLNRLEEEFDEDFFTDLYIDKPARSAKSRGQVRKGFVKVQATAGSPQMEETVRELKLKGVKLNTTFSSRSASPNKDDKYGPEDRSYAGIDHKRMSIDIPDRGEMFDNISLELKERLKEFEAKQQKEEEFLKTLHKLNSDNDLSYKFTKANKYQKDILQGDVSIPSTIPARPFSTVPLHSEEAERPRISHRAYSDTELDARPSKFEKKILDLAQLEEAKFKVLNAIVNKLQTELDILKDRIKKQQDYQNSKNFQLESIKSSKSIKTRDLRELRLEMPLLQEKKRALIQYLQEEFRMQFSKERLRNNHLLATAYEYRQKFIRRNAALERHWEDNVAIKDDVLKNLKGVQGLRDEVMVEVNKAQDDVDFLKAAYEKLNTEVNFKRGEKKQMIKKRMVVDNSLHIKELELLEVALERRRANGGAVKSIKELDSVDLEDFNLTRLPLAQLDSKKVKYINVAKNQLMHLNALGAFSELEAIVSDFNQLKQVNFKDMANLKALSVASNNLTSLEGLSSRLHYLNASANKLTTLKGLETAPNIRILILSSSKIKDMASMKYLKNLLYLDISHSQLSEDVVLQLSSCNQLQCLEAGNNHFRVIPDIPNLALNELHLTKNVLQHLNRMSWLFNLRVLNLYDNQISDISPLSMTPFLKELYLGHNILNTMQINLNQHKAKRMYTLINVFAAIRFFKEVKTQLTYYIDDPKDDTSEMLKIWKDFAIAKDKMIRNYMGPYFSPYLKYLTCKSVASKFDPMSNLAAQERRLFWLSDAITDILKDTEIMPFPTSDGSIIYYLQHLDFRINNCRATHLQAIWRMKMQIRNYEMLREKVLKIQRRLRDYFACIEPRRLLRKLRKEKKEFDAAVMIQKHWKRFHLRGKLEEMRIQHQKELEELAITLIRPVPLSEQDLDHSAMDKDIADIDKWLAEEDELKFDKKMKKYLENESLMHYPAMKKKKPLKKERKKYKTSSKASSSHIVLDKIVVVRDDLDAEMDAEKLFDEDYDSDDKDDSSGSETGSEPPTPPMIDLHHTIQLAKERNDIMINLNRQFNKLVNNLPPTGHLANNDPMVPQSPLKTTTGRIGEPRYGESRFGESRFPNDMVSQMGDSKTVASDAHLNNSILNDLKDQFESGANISTVLDATSFDSASRYTDAVREREDVAWTQYGRRQSFMKLTPEKQALPIIKDSVAQPPKPPKEHKLIFEWDIHPGNVAQKLLVIESQFKPPITLLINNYVASKILRPKPPLVDPNTIHRLEPRSRTKKGQYETMLDLIPSQIVPPAYGSYELPKPEPLPSIAKK